MSAHRKNLDDELLDAIVEVLRYTNELDVDDGAVIDISPEHSAITLSGPTMVSGMHLTQRPANPTVPIKYSR